MFPEMEDEFSPKDFKEEIIAQLEGEEDDNDNFSYRYEIELPYGDIKYTFLYRSKNKKLEDDEHKLNDLNPH